MTRKYARASGKTVAAGAENHQNIVEPTQSHDRNDAGRDQKQHSGVAQYLLGL